MKSLDQTFELDKDLTEMDNVLQNMEDLLIKYKTDITQMNTEISCIQEQSKILETKLTNRKAAHAYMSAFLDGTVISPDLIKYRVITRKICEGEVNEFFLQHLQELNSKIAYVVANEDKNIKAFKNIGPELERLRLKVICVNKAIEKIRDFLLKKIESLKAPNTNIALIQQNVFLKYKELFWFLMERYTPIGLEIHANYIAIVSTYFQSSFEKYLRELQKLQTGTAEKTDLIGLDEGARRGLFGARTALKNAINVFALGNRVLVLTTRDGIIVPHHAEEQNQKFAFEAIFKSLTRLLLDNACSEYVFTCEFFVDKNGSTNHDSHATFFGEVFDPTLKFIEV